MRKTTFEKLGIPYEERDGIFYPVLVAGTEKADIDVGKYGRMWIKYIKEEYPMRYKSLVRFGELEERADEVNDTAYELLDDIEAKWLKKHKPKNPNSFTEQLQLRTHQDDGRGNRYYGCGNAVSLVWGQKAPSKHENGGKKRPQNHKGGADSAPAQIRAEKVWRQKVPSKCKSGGKKRHHSNQSEKSHGGGKCHQNGKAEAENATKQAK